MLSEKLSLLIKNLSVRKTDLAALSGVNRTSLSHIISGKRIPNMYSDAMQKTIAGIYKYAFDNDKLDIISEAIDIDMPDDEEEIKEIIATWLYEDMSVKYFINRSEKNSYILSFKINFLMETLDISNIEMSQRLHIDPTLISRYRNAKRDINLTSTYSADIIGDIYRRIELSDDAPYISRISGINIDELSLDTFTEWLTNPDAPIINDKQNSSEIILDAFSSIASGNKKVAKSDDIAASQNISDTKNTSDTDNAAASIDNSSTYIGNEGLRRSVDRFFEAAITDKPECLYLYSDVSMAWMTEDEDFFKRWQMSMLTLVAGGVKIRIIHNVKRNSGEMTNAIVGWLPLYQTGMIEPYYFESRHRNNIFSHTIFINPKGYAITGMTVNGTEVKTIYNYHTDAAEIALLMDSYTHMSRKASPLIELSQDIPDEADAKTYTYNGIRIILHKNIVYLTHIKTGVNIGFKHPSMVQSFYDFCEGL